MVMVERSKDWMDQAEGDLEHAKSDLRLGFYDWACFPAQQSAGKAVKAVFQKLGAEAWGHSVFDLISSLSDKIELAASYWITLWSSIRRIYPRVTLTRIHLPLPGGGIREGKLSA